MGLPTGDTQLVQIMDAALAEAAQLAGPWLACRPAALNAATALLPSMPSTPRACTKGWWRYVSPTYPKLRESKPAPNHG
jgi:hypothetical protein